MAWKVYVFVQGRGWTELSQVFSHRGVVSTREEALDLGASVVMKSIQEARKPAGSAYGDAVGFRLIETNEEPEDSPKDLSNWADVRHRFYRRDDCYMLYKTWSWPD